MPAANIKSPLCNYLACITSALCSASVLYTEARPFIP